MLVTVLLEIFLSETEQHLSMVFSLLKYSANAHSLLFYTVHGLSGKV